MMSSDDEKAIIDVEEKISVPETDTLTIDKNMDITSPLKSPVDSQNGNEVEDDDDESVGYEESAERDEIIRERINRTQESMR